MTQLGRIWGGGAGWAAALSALLFVGCQRDAGADGRAVTQQTPQATSRETAHAAATASAPADEAAGATSDMARPEPALSDIVQLTSGLPRAGEAYFSRDAKW